MTSHNVHMIRIIQKGDEYVADYDIPEIAADIAKARDEFGVMEWA